MILFFSWKGTGTACISMVIHSMNMKIVIQNFSIVEGLIENLRVMKVKCKKDH